MKNKFRKYLKQEDFVVKKPKVSKDYQIGYLVANGLVHKLPTLSTDPLRTFNVIEVPETLSNKWKEMESEWFALGRKDEEKSNELFYRNLAWYKENIEAVFLKDTIEFIVYNFYEKEFTEEMVKGFKRGLWGCDLSHYIFHSAEVCDFSCTVTITLKYQK